MRTLYSAPATTLRIYVNVFATSTRPLSIQTVGAEVSAYCTCTWVVRMSSGASHCTSIRGCTTPSRVCRAVAAPEVRVMVVGGFWAE